MKWFEKVTPLNLQKLKCSHPLKLNLIGSKIPAGDEDVLLAAI